MIAKTVKATEILCHAIEYHPDPDEEGESYEFSVFRLHPSGLMLVEDQAEGDWIADDLNNVCCGGDCLTETTDLGPVELDRSVIKAALVHGYNVSGDAAGTGEHARLILRTA